jgi:hypothetical protein
MIYLSKLYCCRGLIYRSLALFRDAGNKKGTSKKIIPGYS